MSVAEQPQVIYVGSQGGMEASIVARESTLPFRALPTAALRGRGPLELLVGSGRLLAGVWAARRLLRGLRPAAILGTGGYVCVPLFVAARWLGIPTLIYLPDVVPGLAVRVLARIATQVACNVDDSRHHLPARSGRGKPLLVTGYPVRAALFTQERAACKEAFGLRPDEPVLLVYGGSRGARSINRAIQALLPALLGLAQIIHICGREGDEVWLRERAAQLEEEQRARYRLYAYLEDQGSATMTGAFGAADLAVCRSGASTLAELPAAGLPAVLVPYPYVHQDENADYLVRHGAAVKVADDALPDAATPQASLFWQQVQQLMTDHAARARMAAHSRALAQPQAAHHLAGALLHLATHGNQVPGT